MVKEGQRITYKAKGKLARLEGKAGQWVTGVVLGLRGDENAVLVMPDHRTVEGAVFKDLAAIIEVKAIKKGK